MSRLEVEKRGPKTWTADVYSMVAKGTGPTRIDLSTRRAALPQDKERTPLSVANFPRTRLVLHRMTTECNSTNLSFSLRAGRLPSHVYFVSVFHVPFTAASVFPRPPLPLLCSWLFITEGLVLLCGPDWYQIVILLCQPPKWD